MTAIKRHPGSGGFQDDTLSASSSSQSKFLSVFDRETHYPVFSSLCGYLSTSEIVSLTRTCKKLSSLYRYLLPVQWDVDAGLRRYFDDPKCFRSQMAKDDALLIGSFAIRYFERTVCACAPLEVVVQRGGSQLVSKYLSDEAGYKYVNNSTTNQNSLIAEVRFRRSSLP